MKPQLTIILTLLLATPVFAQTHTDESGGFGLAGDGYSYLFETHYINVPGANYLRLYATVSAADYGFAQIQIFSANHQTQYGTLSVNAGSSSVSDQDYYIIPNNCAIHLTVYAIGAAGINYFADPRGISFTYDQAGNRTNRNIVYLTGSSSKKSLTSNSEMIAQIENEIEELRQFKIYPNPSTQHIFVALSEKALEVAERRIILYDNTGRQIIDKKVHDDIIQLDLSSLANGFYVVKLIYGTESEECVVIKK